MIIAADIGGTKSACGYFDIRGGGVHPVIVKKYPSRNYSSLQQVTRQFIEDIRRAGHDDKISAACFSLAGPVADGRCSLVNLEWQADLEQMKNDFPEIGCMTFINDLEASASYVKHLRDADIVRLCAGREESGRAGGNIAVIAPGTGLGEAFIAGGRVFPCEGGHTEFGPRSDEEMRLWRYLRNDVAHVSYERVLAGEGLCRIYRFLMHESGIEETKEEISPADVSTMAMEGCDPLCIRALDMYMSILGAEAGNMALKYLAYGGVYISGGIAPKILPALKGGAFAEGFRSKGRYGYITEKIPVWVIKNEDTALYGSAVRAAQMAADAADAEKTSSATD